MNSSAALLTWWLLMMTAGWGEAAAQEVTEAPPLTGIPMSRMVPKFADVSYGSDERHRLDVWQAPGDAPAPLVIFIHGGGWHGGDKSDIPPKLLAFLLERGLSVASINYRFTSRARLPGPVHDAARAVQFLRSRAADWNFHSGRFGAWGISAGGCTALWLACHDDLADPGSDDPVARQSTRLQAAVGISPQTSLEPRVIVPWLGEQVLQHPMIARAVGAKNGQEVLDRYSEWGATLREFSPINHLSRDDPPVLVAFPTFAKLPAASAGQAIHHAVFGVKLKERAEAIGSLCLLRIENQTPQASPKPEEFLIEHLVVKDVAN
jgi:acetyl esterase/lipase